MMSIPSAKWASIFSSFQSIYQTDRAFADKFHNGNVDVIKNNALEQRNDGTGQHSVTAVI